MQKQFCTYEIALKLKKLGFNEKCEAIYNPIFLLDGCWNTTNSYIDIFNKDTPDIVCAAPLWQQVIDWFDSRNIFITVEYIGQNSFMFKIYGVTGLTSIFNSRQECTKQAILKAIELISK